MSEKPQLTLYNSLTREKEVFTPQDPKRVTMYNCGPTVYSYAHIGNARAAVVADVLFRVLRHIYGEDHVVYARNITDVDDKIIQSAKEQGVDISEITEKFARIYQEDLRAIGCLDPDEEPRATDHIQEMADIIITLMDKDIAYASEGHVLFDVTKMENYGKLSGRKLDDNLAGARVEVASYKRNAGDFVLWKPAKSGEPGWGQQESSETYKVDWKHYGNRDFANSPGRPGWHIECSAMAKAVLCDEEYGNTIDIHCGGIDLKFPHHENEIAQSECANDTEFSKFWVHNEFLNMGKDKMSKSLGNVKLIHDLLKDWDGEVIRLALLKAHYRSELVWTEELLKESKAQLDRWYRAKEIINTSAPDLMKYRGWLNLHPNIEKAFLGDVNTPLLVMNNNVHVDEIIIRNKNDHLFNNEAAGAFIFQSNYLLGLLQKDPKEWFRGGLDYDALVAEYDEVRAQALAAKEAGDKAAMGQYFKRSDEIRDKFKSEGVVIESGAGGKSSWRKA